MSGGISRQGLAERHRAVLAAMPNDWTPIGSLPHNGQDLRAFQGILKTLASRGLVEHRTHGRQGQWRRTPSTTKGA